MKKNATFRCQRSGLFTSNTNSPILQSLAMPFSFSRLFLKSVDLYKCRGYKQAENFFFLLQQALILVPYLNLQVLGCSTSALCSLASLHLHWQHSLYTEKYTTFYSN